MRYIPPVLLMGALFLSALIGNAREQAAAPVPLSYACIDGSLVQVVYFNDTQDPERSYAVLAYNRELHVLTNVVSASGARYIDAVAGEDGLGWWEHDEHALLEGLRGAQGEHLSAQECSLSEER